MALQFQDYTSTNVQDHCLMKGLGSLWEPPLFARSLEPKALIPNLIEEQALKSCFGFFPTSCLN